jgi:hypothetical protein
MVGRDGTLRDVSEPKASWLDDPHLARTLARYTWAVVVAVFVLATRFDFGVAGTFALVGALVLATAVLNAPVVLGLWRSRAYSHTRPFRIVAFTLLVRASSVAWVAWMLASMQR